MLPSNSTSYSIERLIRSSDQVNIYRISDKPVQQGSSKKQTESVVKQSQKNCYRIKFGHLRLNMFKLEELKFDPHIKSSNVIDMTTFHVNEQHLEFITQPWDQTLEEFLTNSQVTLSLSDKSQMLNDLFSVLADLEQIGCRFRLDVGSFAVINNRLLLCPHNILLLYKSNKEEGNRIIDYLTREQRTSCFYMSEIADVIRKIVTTKTETGSSQTEAELEETYLKSIDESSREIVKKIYALKEEALKSLSSCKFSLSGIANKEPSPFHTDRLNTGNEEVVVRIQANDIASFPSKLQELKTRDATNVSDKSPPQEKTAKIKENSTKITQPNTPPTMNPSKKTVAPDPIQKNPWGDSVATDHNPKVIESFAISQTNLKTLEQSIMIADGVTDGFDDLDGKPKLDQFNGNMEKMYESYEQPKNTSNVESVILQQEIINEPGQFARPKPIQALPPPIQEQQVNNIGMAMKKNKLKEIKTSKCIEDEIKLFKHIDYFFDTLSKSPGFLSQPASNPQQARLAFLMVCWSEFNEMKAALTCGTNRFNTKDFCEFIKAGVSSLTERLDELILKIKPIIGNLIKRIKEYDYSNPFDDEPSPERLNADNLIGCMESAKQLFRESKGLPEELISKLKSLLISIDQRLPAQRNKFEEDCKLFNTYVLIYINKRDIFNFACSQAKEQSTISYELFLNKAKDPEELEKIANRDSAKPQL